MAERTFIETNDTLEDSGMVFSRVLNRYAGFEVEN